LALQGWIAREIYRDRILHLKDKRLELPILKLSSGSAGGVF